MNPRKILFLGFSLLFLVAAFAVSAQTGKPPSRDQALIQGLVGYPDLDVSPARVTTSNASARTATNVIAYSYVRIFCTVDTSFRMGGAATDATTADPIIPAGSPEVFNMGNNTRVAFILTAGSGACDVTVLR